MAQPMTIALPPGVDLWDGCIIRVTALDPTTGNTVTGVNVSNVTLHVAGTIVNLVQVRPGQWRLVPGPGA